MRCFSPIQIRASTGYTPIKQGKNATETVTVPCGRCSACLSNRRTDWTNRLLQEQKVSKSSYFVTLTYNDEHLPIGYEGIPVLFKPDVQNFMKRLRKKSKNKLKYYLVGEYGGKTHRPHYHMILFNLEYTGNKLLKVLHDTWQKGHIDIGTVTIKSIRYTTGYIIQKKDSKDWIIERPFSLMSKNLGISYVEKMKKWHTADLTRNYIPKENGEKSRLPRYYRDKIFTTGQKEEQSWLLEEINREEFNEEQEKDKAQNSIVKAEIHRKKQNNKNEKL